MEVLKRRRGSQHLGPIRGSKILILTWGKKATKGRIFFFFFKVINDEKKLKVMGVNLMVA